jgi:hypothetical protein
MQAPKPNLINTHLTLHEFRLGFVRVENNVDFLGTRLEEEISKREREMYILKREREIWRRMRNGNWVIIKMAWRYRFFSKPH